MELYINGTLVASSDYASIYYTWNTTQYDNGNYKLLAKAYDEVGNINSTYIFVTVDPKK